MFKLIAYWSAPASTDDVAQFEAAYRGHHMAIATKVPGLQRLTTTLIAQEAAESEVEHYRLAELYFQNRDAFDTATASAEWRALLENSRELADRFGASVAVQVGEEESVPIDGTAGTTVIGGA